MCSEGPWPGCFSRSVSVLGRGTGAQGHQAMLTSPIPDQVFLLPHTASSGEKRQPLHWSHLGAGPREGPREMMKEEV